MTVLIDLVRDAEYAIGQEDAGNGASPREITLRDGAVKALLEATHTVGGLLARPFEVVEYEDKHPLHESRIWCQYGWCDSKVNWRVWLGADRGGWSDWSAVRTTVGFVVLKYQAWPLTFVEANEAPVGRWKP